MAVDAVIKSGSYWGVQQSSTWLSAGEAGGQSGLGSQPAAWGWNDPYVAALLFNVECNDSYVAAFLLNLGIGSRV